MALLVEEDQITMLGWSDLLREPEELDSPGDTGLDLVPLLYEMDLLLGCHWNGPVCLHPLCLQEFNEFVHNLVLAPPVPTVRQCCHAFGENVLKVWVLGTAHFCTILEVQVPWTWKGVVTGLDQVTESCFGYPPHVIQHSPPPGRSWPTPREVSQGLCRVAALALPARFCIHFPPFPLPVITFLSRASFLYLWIVVNSLNSLFLS